MATQIRFINEKTITVDQDPASLRERMGAPGGISVTTRNGKAFWLCLLNAYEMTETEGRAPTVHSL